MARRWWALVAISSLLTIQLGTTAPSSAQPDEPSSGPVVTLTSDGLDPSTVVDRHGNATVVWGTHWWRGRIMAVRRPAGGSWSTPVTIGRGTQPQIVTDAAGNVTVVFQTNRRGFTTGLSAVRRPLGGAWGSPVRLTVDRPANAYTGDDEGTYGAHRWDVAVSPNGDVVVVWQWGSGDRNRPFRIEVARRPHGGTWSGPLPLTARDWSDEPEVGIDRDGRATLVYRARSSTLVSRRLVPGSGWAGPVRLRSAAAVLSHDLVVTPDGATTLMLQVYRDGRNTIAVMQRPAAGPWSATTRLSPEGVYCTDGVVAVDGTGVVSVAWTRMNGRIDLVRRTDGAWSSPFLITGEGQNSETRLAVNPAGDLAAWWHNESLGIRGRVRDRAGAWTPRFTLWPAGYYEAIQGAAYPDGDLLSVVQRGDSIRARRLDRG